MNSFAGEAVYGRCAIQEKEAGSFGRHRVVSPELLPDLVLNYWQLFLTLKFRFFEKDLVKSGYKKV